MSGLEFLFRKTLSNPSDLTKLQGPTNFKEAFNDLIAYCEKQLPVVIDADFVPISFDITNDESSMVLGGRHGNIATFEVDTKRIIRDEEICRSQVISLSLAANDTQVVVLTSKFELLFLDFPSYTIAHRIELREEQACFRVRQDKDLVYVSNMVDEILVVAIDKADEVDDRNYKEKRMKINEIVVTFDLSDDGLFLALGLEDGVIRLKHTDSEADLQATEPYSCYSNLLCFSEHRRHLAGAFLDFVIKVWSLGSSVTLVHTLDLHTQPVVGLAFVKDNRYLISGGKDSAIIMSDMKVERKPFSMNLTDGEIMWFKPSHDHKKLYFNQDKPNFSVWDVPTLNKNARYRKHTGTVNKILFVPESFEIISIGSDGLLVVWDYRNDFCQDLVQLEGELLNMDMSASARFLIVLSSKPCIYKFNLANFKYTEYELQTQSVALRISFNEEHIAITDNLSRIGIYDAEELNKQNVIKGHLGIVSEVYFLESDDIILSASHDRTLGKWKMETGERLATFTGHKSPITKMALTKEGWVISASTDCNVIIWNLQGISLYSIFLEKTQGQIKGLFLSEDNMHMITLQEEFLTYWQMYNLSIIFQVDVGQSPTCFAMSKDERIITIGEGETLFIEENPIRTSNPRIVGRNLGAQHKFMKYILESIKNNVKSNYEPEYNHFVYTPYLIGTAHLLTFSNKIDELSKSLFDEQNPAPFFSSLNNENPLSISTQLAYKNCINICLKYLRSNIKKNPRAFVPIESCLTELNKIDFPEITRIYDILFQKCSAQHLPDFCLHETKLPALYHSDQLVIFPENIISNELYSSNGRSIVFFKSLCPLDLDTGTEGSIDFLQSLLECSSSEIFQSKLLQVLLLNKWDRVRWAVYGQGLLYIVYMCCLSVYCISFRYGYPGFLIFLFIIHVMLFFYEVTQIATDFLDYWGDMWNILDQLRGLSFTVYCILLWRGEDNNDVLLSVIIFSWTRGISYFRMFNGTRYMVRLLAEVIKDMREFFVILLYSTLSFTFILLIRNPGSTFLEYLTISYRLDLGDFDADYHNVFDWIIFFLATMLNPLIMLNLLISIMGDTYGVVQESSIIANFQELTEMIIEIEKLMFWKKRLNHKHFLQQCDFVTHDEGGSEKNLEKMRGLKMQLMHVEKRCYDIKSMLNNNNILEMEGYVYEIKRDQEVIKKDVRLAVEKSAGLIQRISHRLNKLEE